MKKQLLEYLRCPACQDKLSLEIFEEDQAVAQGLLQSDCGKWYPILDYVPRILVDPSRGDYTSFLKRYRAGDPIDSYQNSTSQIQESFTYKWNRMPQFGFQGPQLQRFYDNWFQMKLGFSEQAPFHNYLKEKKRILDAGTGLGAKVETISRVNPDAIVFGVDISESAVPAYSNTRECKNAHILQADLTSLPFEPSQFDLIISDGVLHHMPDPKQAFLSLLPYLAPQGDIAIHLYKKQGPIREFSDELIRSRSTRMTAEECWGLSEAFTKLGQALAKVEVTVEIPSEIPILEIPAGQVDVQRLIYTHLFQCFWNNDFSFDENVLVNFDWFHPQHASHHTPEEVLQWFETAELTDIQLHQPNESGISIIGKRAA